MTPENAGRALAASLRPPADPDELRADSGVVTRILNAERRLALVELAGGASVVVPYGVGRPRVGHRYPVYSTAAGDRWLKAGGQTWCKVWTESGDFNEDGATFEGDMLDPAPRDRLELPVFLPFGDGADGAGVHDLDDGDVNLNIQSICGRTELGLEIPDAPYVVVSDWFTVIDDVTGLPQGKVAPESAPMVGLAVGDEVLLYVAQAKAGAADGPVGDVGRWEAHRVHALAVDGTITYQDYVRPPPSSISGFIIFCQRIPNYTTISQTGSLNASAITCGAYNIGSGSTPEASGAGTGVVFVRASVSSTARYTSIGGGFAGGLNGEFCENLGGGLWWQESNPGHGKRQPNGSDGDGGRGKFGGGGAGGNGDCTTGPLNTAHVAATGHNADIPSAGGGGGHATAGGTPVDNTRHRRAGVLGPYDYAGRPGGTGGIVIGDSELVAPAAYHGYACFGGGGGAAGDYTFDGSTTPAGPGGNGGGFVAVFAASMQANNGVGFTIPTIDVNGGDGGFLSGGGAGGSIVVWTEVLGSAIALDPWLMAEKVTIAGANTGRSGGGGGAITNAFDVIEAPGAGGVGRVRVHYETTKHGYTANGSINETSGPPTYAGCWGSAIHDSESLGMGPGMLVEPTALRADWTLDSDGLKPTFYLIGGDQPDLSDGVTYPTTDGERFWQDGGTNDIDDDTELDLTSYGLTPALYWQVWACLESGAGTDDTPTIGEISLCGTAS